MGVDHTANCGLGYKLVRPTEQELEEKYNDDIYDWVESLDGIEGVDTFDVGDEAYSGDENDWYIVMEDPFKDGGAALPLKIWEFEKLLKKNGIKVEGEFNLHSGVCVW